ncbi:Helix-turn-helix domain protein [Phycisphaerae bacterium RAS1]|nr:Helix-turn-helix domain protein [Phycisphaerae bacterium RAS1]
MRELVTPRQVARAIGVSEASLKRWCDKGHITCVRTAGGHRRLPVDAVLDFLRRHRRTLVHPELLRLPPASGNGELGAERSAKHVLTALCRGQEDHVRQIVAELFLAGHSACSICDDVLTPAMHRIGERWQASEVCVYQERRACELCLDVIAMLRRMIPPPGEHAPLAIGGTLEGDAYALPGAMVELALREAGWRAESHGSGLPADTLREALRAKRPVLMWLSVSSVADPERFIAQYGRLYSLASEMGVAIVVGGRALLDGLRKRIRYCAYCDTLAHLVTFACTISRPAHGAGTES